MKRILKIGLLGLLGLVIILVGVATWLLNDEAFLRRQIEGFFIDRTGRHLTLGRIDIDLGKQLHIRAEEIRVANPQWALKENLANISKLDATIDTYSLLHGRLEVGVLSLDHTELNLQEDQSGEVSWNFDIQDGEEPEEDTQATLVPWDQLRISDFELSHISPDRAVPLDFRIQQFEADHSPEGRVSINGRGVIGGYPLELDGYLDPLDALFTGDSMSYQITALLGDIRLESEGTIANAVTGAGAQFETRFTGPDIGWLLEQAALPEFSSGPFDVEINLDWNDDNSLLLDLNGDLGSFTASADGKLDRLVNPGSLDLIFEVNGPDLMALGEALGIDYLPQAPYRFSGDADLDRRSLNIDRFEAQVGGDLLTMSGKVGQWPDLTGTKLNITATGRDISVWGPAMGLTGWKSNPFTLTGRFMESGGFLDLSKTSIVLGESRIMLEGKLGKPPDLLGSDIGVDLEISDLGNIAGLEGFEFSRQLPVKFDGQISRNPKGVQIENGMLSSSQHRLALNGLVTLLPGAELPSSESWTTDLAGSHINAGLNTPSAKALAEIFDIHWIPDQSLSLTIDGALDDAGLSYRIITDQTGPIRADANGRLPKSLELEGASVQFKVDLPSLKTIESFSEVIGLPDLPLAISGSLIHSAGGIELDGIGGTLGNARFTFAGELQLEPEFRVTRGAFSASGPEFRAYYDHEDLVGLPPQFDISGQFSTSDNLQQIEHLSASFGESELEISGTVDRFIKPGTFDLLAELRVPDPEELDPFVQYHGDFPFPRKSIELDFGLRGSPTRMEFSNLELVIGESRANGEFFLGLETVPEIRGSLNSENLDLGWLRIFDEDSEPAEDPVAGPEESKSETPAEKPQRVFDDDPLPLLVMDPVLVDLTFDFGEIQLGGLKLSAVNIGVKLTDSMLQLDPLRLTDSAGGKVSGTVSISRADGEVYADIEGEATGFRSGLAADPNQPVSTYPATDFFIDMTAHGASPHEMAISADGELKIVVGQGQILNTRLNLLFSDLIFELFGKLNPFFEESEHTNFDCGVAVWEFGEGRAQINPMILQTDKIVSTSKGSVNLDSEKIDIRFNTRPRRGIGLSAGTLITPFIKVGGSLSDPSIVLDPSDAALQGGAAVASGGLTLVGKSLFDRFLRQRDPCGKVVAELSKMDDSAESQN